MQRPAEKPGIVKGRSPLDFIPDPAAHAGTDETLQGFAR